ncbi:MAG: HNH endonuclease [bacterium]|nr:HNH endonuclease [bacterium]
MTAYLFSWNPKLYPWGSLQDELETSRSGGRNERWNIGETKRIHPGEPFFLIRLGSPPKGLVGSGWVVSEPFEASHWDLEKARAGQQAIYVDVVFEFLREQPYISLEALQQPPLDAMHWATRISGVRIRPEVRGALEEHWAAAVGLGRADFPRESQPPGFSEGGASRSSSLRYTRNIAAREACLAHYGTSCVVCKMSFGESYGEVASSYIHVHHLAPISEASTVRSVDPENDLRPVCPNCHAVIHMREPPYTIEELRQMMQEARLK